MRLSEKNAYTTRKILASIWILLIVSLFYDPISHILSVSNDSCYKFQDQCLKTASYPLGAKIFWGIVVPSSILIIIVFGHEFWRRVCPLSFFSQIPRSLGLHRKQISVDKQSSLITKKLYSISPDSWLGRNAIFVQFSLLYIGLCVRLLFTNSDRLALGIYLILIIIAAITTGYMYQGKTWCHYFCPMGPVQTVYTGTRGIFGTAAHLETGITQSMCRTIENGTEESACVGCKSPCIDIDSERNYWDTIEAPGRSLMQYGYSGLVFGFFISFPLYTGNWSYLNGAVWQESQLMTVLSPGLYLINKFPIPKLLSVPLTLAISTFCFYAIGIGIENQLQKYNAHKKDYISLNTKHQLFTIFTAIAFILFLIMGVCPSLSSLPKPIKELVVISSLFIIYTWVQKQLKCNLDKYKKESVSNTLRTQIIKSGCDLKDVLNGKSIDSLSVDEVYTIAKVLPGFSKKNLIEVYQSMIKDSMDSTQEISSSGLLILKQFREKLNISDREHTELLHSLGAENSTFLRPSEAESREESKRLKSYTRLLELLLTDSLDAGIPLDTLISQKRIQILALKEEYSITIDENDYVLSKITSRDGTISKLLQQNILRLEYLELQHQLFIQLPDSIESSLILREYNYIQEKEVILQVLNALELLGRDGYALTSVVNLKRILTSNLYKVFKKVISTENWRGRLHHDLVSLLTNINIEYKVAFAAKETSGLLRKLFNESNEPLIRSAILDVLSKIDLNSAIKLAESQVPNTDIEGNIIARILKYDYLEFGILEKFCILRRIEYFELLNFESIFSLALLSKVESYSSGFTICKEGEVAHDFIFVVSGTCLEQDSFYRQNSIISADLGSAEDETVLFLPKSGLPDSEDETVLFLPKSGLPDSEDETVLFLPKSGLPDSEDETVLSLNYKNSKYQSISVKHIGGFKFLSNAEYLQTVDCSTFCQVLIIPGNRFKDVITSDPESTTFLMKTISS